MNVIKDNQHNAIHYLHIHSIYIYYHIPFTSDSINEHRTIPNVTYVTVCFFYCHYLHRVDLICWDDSSLLLLSKSSVYEYGNNVMTHARPGPTTRIPARLSPINQCVRLHIYYLLFYLYLFYSICSFESFSGTTNHSNKL